MTRGHRFSSKGREAALALVVVLALGGGVRGQEVEERVRTMMQQMLRTNGAAAETDAQSEDDGAPAATPRGTPSPNGTPVPLTEPEVAVAPAGTVTLNVVDLPLATVLRVLALETRRNIIATPGVSGTVTASLHDVTFEEALDAILLANNAGYRTSGKFIYVYTLEELAHLAENENPPISRVFRLSYIPAKEAEAAIKPVLSERGSVTVSLDPEVGLSPGAESAGGESPAGANYIVVYDRPANVAQAERIIRELDVRPLQVLVEATVLSCQLDDENALGVDFTLLGGVDLELLGSTSAAIQNVNVGALPQDRFGNFNSSVTTPFTDNVPDGGMRLGIIKDHVAVFIEALERVTDTVVLANPKVLALNKQKGQVIVGRRDGYLTTTVTETQAIQTVEFLETGTQLFFRPFIGQDGFVRMELHPEDSIGGLNASNLPFEQTTEVTTNVIVKDGQTILIGGMFREVDSDTRAQIPLLGNIPGVGALFQSRQDRLGRQEVMILLTVHVVKDFDAYAEEGRTLLESAERQRVAAREGQMNFSRERLAQSFYEEALEAYAAADLETARWKLGLALYNYPRHHAAIMLQEQLRQERAWQDDATSSRGYIHEAIMRRRGPVEPLFGRPAPPFGPLPQAAPPVEVPALEVRHENQ
jgi:type IV pilus assembly protein PilQ